MKLRAAKIKTNSVSGVKKTFLGKEHLIVPATLLAEGVLECMTCTGPEYISGDELEKFAAAWNGRPITADHPVVNGEPVSAGSPEVLENVLLGHVFNVKFVDGLLKGDLWFDLDRAATIEYDIEGRLASDEQIEVSTGYFAEIKEIPGEFDGKAYTAIQTNIKPDHLAVLPPGVVGACSWGMGCGIRANCAGGGCACDKKLTPPCDNPAEETPNMKNLKELRLKTLAASDQDIARALNAALAEKGSTWAWVEAVFSSDGYFVYYDEGSICKRDFSISDDGAITLGEEITKVRAETSFLPVVVNKERNMKKDELIASLIGNAATKFTDEDKTWLEALDEGQLEKLVPNAQKTEEAKTTVSEDAPIAEQISMIPNAQVRKVVEHGLKMLKKHEDTLVQKIAANKANKFSEKELRALAEKDVDLLEKLASLAETPDYSGQRPLIDNRESNTDDNAVPVRPKLFARN